VEGVGSARDKTLLDSIAAVNNGGGWWRVVAAEEVAVEVEAD